jgi:hypothetical protein
MIPGYLQVQCAVTPAFLHDLDFSPEPTYGSASVTTPGTRTLVAVVETVDRRVGQANEILLVKG